MDLARLGQVGDAGVRAHEHVDGVERALQETALRLREVDPAQRRLRQVVVRHQCCKTELVNLILKMNDHKKKKNSNK